MQLELEILAEERARRWEAELALRARMAHLPRRPARWQGWLGKGLVRGGGWLTRWGKALTLHPYCTCDYCQALPPGGK